MFSVIDVDGDGVLSREDIRKAYNVHLGRNLTNEDIDDIFQRVDTDLSGFIDYPEFLAAGISHSTMCSNLKLQQGFALFDKDGGGSIEVDELKEVLNANGDFQDEEIEQIAREADLNGDGEISFEEFIYMMNL